MHRRILSASLIASSLAIFSALLAGCGSSHSTTGPTGQGGSSSPFSVTSSVPASGAMNVALSSTIQIVFSSAASAATVNTTNIVVSDSSGAVSGSVSYNSSNNTATFTPSAALVANTTYTVKVSGVTSSSGMAITADTFSFTTVGASASLQYQATLEGNSNNNAGQVTVDATGNYTAQLLSAAASETFTVQFCPLVPVNGTSPNCFSIGTLSTNASGDGSTTAMFPKSGAWVGDFQLVSGSSANPAGTNYAYSTVYSPVYTSTLVPTAADTTLDGNAVTNQAPLKSGTITYSSSPSPNGSLTFALTGGPANDYMEVSEGGLVPYDYYTLGGGASTNSAGDLTYTAPPSGMGGDIFDVSPQNGQKGWEGGFSVPAQ